MIVLATSGVFCVPFNGSMLYNKKLDRNDGEKKMPLKKLKGRWRENKKRELQRKRANAGDPGVEMTTLR
jgi:hypothetical protein